MKIDLIGADTLARSSLASCQRTLNLYAEKTQKELEEPSSVTHYPTPGLRKLGVTPSGHPIRGLYRASNGDLYAVAGFEVYYIDPMWGFNLIGTMNTTNSLFPTKMADNGINVILCDGTMTNGYAITMSTRSGLTPLLNPSASDAETASSTGWLGSTNVDFSDGFLIANFIGTPSWYISNAEDIIFDPLQFAGKTSYPDPLVAAVVQHRVVWLIGQMATEVWYNSGGAGAASNFPFEIMPGVAIDWGCIAPYSIAKAETAVLWLAQNLNGEVVVLHGSGYSVSRISTHALEYQISLYGDVSDAIAYCYMQNGHSFYQLSFPRADKTWVYDLAMGQWAERCYLDANGVEHRHRSSVHAFAYNTNVVIDWETGNLYALDLKTFTDNGMPIKRLIDFPRQVDNDDGHRVMYHLFQAELDCGESTNPTDNPMVTFRWSDDKGKTWSNGLVSSLGRMGEFLRIIRWTRLGLARSRVFELEWAANSLTALQGAWVNVTKAGA